MLNFNILQVTVTLLWKKSKEKWNNEGFNFFKSTITTLEI